MRNGKLMLVCAGVAMAAGCAESDVEGGGGDGHAHYTRELRGASAHQAAVGGVSRNGEVALDRVFAAGDLAPALGRFTPGDFAISTTMQASASGAPLTFVSGRQMVHDVPIVDSH